MYCSTPSISITAAPVPPAVPTTQVTQPTCATPTGTITLTPATGVEYQLDNGTFGPYPANGWSGLAPSSTHTITVRSTTDNTCTTPTGTITLTPATGVEYQLDNGTFGPYPANGWSGLAPSSTHTITVRST